MNIYSLVNGRSVFGVRSEGVRIPLGSVVIDDAHASLEHVEDQFTLVIQKKEKKGTYETFDALRAGTRWPTASKPKSVSQTVSP